MKDVAKFSSNWCAIQGHDHASMSSQIRRSRVVMGSPTLLMLLQAPGSASYHFPLTLLLLQRPTKYLAGVRGTSDASLVIAVPIDAQSIL